MLDRRGVATAFEPFAELVEQAYNEFDATIERLQLSLDLSSKELRKRNDDLHTVFQVFPDIFIWLDESGRIIDLRGGATGKFTGIRREDHVGMLLWQSSLVDDPGPFAEMFDKGLQEVRECVRTQNGEEICCEIRFVPADRQTTVVVIRDISSLKAKSTQLVAAEKHYRSFFENATEGIIIATFEGKIVAANPAFAAMFGYDGPDHIKEKVTDIASQLYYDSTDRLKLLKNLKAVGQVKELELRFRHHDGSIVWIAANVRRIYKEGRYFIEGSVRDITKRREAEIALQEAHDRLEQTGAGENCPVDAGQRRLAEDPRGAASRKRTG